MKAVRSLAAALVLSSVAPLCAQPTGLLIERAAPLRLGVSGEPGRTYYLESTATPGVSNSWERHLTLTLTNSSQGWFDAASLLTSFRVYRVGKETGPEPVERPHNFRLVDHQNFARELGVESDARAVVLFFAGGACTNISQFAPAISALQSRYAASNVLFWLVRSDPAAARSNLASVATAAGLNLPVLHDAGQLVARAYRAGASMEAVAVDPQNWHVFYRGAIDDRTGSGTNITTQPYLAAALAQFLAGQPVAIRSTRPQGCGITQPARWNLTYTNIAPILQAKCVRCHSSGNIAPFAFDSYATVTNWAPFIHSEVLAGNMPPWHADAAFGTFTNDLSLTATQKMMLLQWVEDGMPRGAGADPLATIAPSTNYPFAWPSDLGTPDHIVNVPAYNVPASGEVDYVYPSFTVPIPSNVWLRAAVVKPGNTRVVHHVLVFLGPADLFAQNGGLNGFFAGYVPGLDATTYPAGTAKLLTANSTLTCQMHYTTMGTPVTDNSQIGLYFMRTNPSLSLITRAASLSTLTLPPHTKDVPYTASVIPSTTRDIWLYEVSPHMHYRGWRFRYEAVLPNNAGTNILVNVPRYDFHWQNNYRFAQPVFLPRGTAIRAVGGFNNSAQNPDNPNPALTIGFGEQTDDEMFIGYFNYAEIP